MWFYWRLLCVNWTDRRTNESVLRELDTTRKSLANINKRRLKYVGHVSHNKNTDLMTVIYQGKTEARRKKGRPPVSYIENITKISGLNIQEVVH